ncbi:acetylserotonin O-methyltransferase [Actinokineospora sp. PR83]|uniref:acetylserotonin O-methyltransferase n=1 Tax=Actinokineospora sp. PR83 TaxID=2884908 RepID=UPI001F3ABD7A|nr:acetylserotonin O-methyltransferase [Actinokineospora sp. PR83]MCG8915245.1 acetylserotonin O-methyltransferase [Actinokineospora sp. PR83]
MDEFRTDTESVRLLQLSGAYLQARAVHLAAKLDLADLLVDGPRSAAELAGETGTNPDALYRLMRLLAGCGIFTEQSYGIFSLTNLGERLTTDHPSSVRTKVAMNGFLASVFTNVEYSLRTGKPAFDEEFGQPFFQYLREHPEKGALFAAGMAEQSRIEATAVLESHDFAAAGPLIDVGGGNGAQLLAIAQRHRALRGVLFDQPQVAEAAGRRFAEHGVADRCTAIGGDFFADVPPGGRTYLLKSVLHDWSDDDARTILTSCRRVMGPGSTLLVVERVLPEGDAPHPSKAFDLAMLVLLGGRERTASEYTALLTETGFRPTRTVATGSPLSIIEAVPTD